MPGLEIRAIPRDLYYHEVAYVRGLEAALEAIIRMAKRGSESTDMTRTAFREGLADIEASAKFALSVKP